MFNLGIIETAPSKVGLPSVTWLAMQQPDGVRFVVVAQEPFDKSGRYLERYEAGQAVRLPSIPHAIVHALEE